MTTEIEFRTSPPEQQEQFRQQATRWAREARAQALRDFLAWLFAKAATVARQAFEAYQTWRTRREAIRELHSLDNRMLRDMGIGRSEIDWLVTSGAPSQSSERNSAVTRRPPAVSNAARNRTRIPEKRAA